MIMGHSYIFKCKKCDYAVESSGKLDYGMFAVVKPFICSTCEEVFDVQIGEMGQVIPEEMLNKTQKEEYYKCPECKGKKLTEWNPRYRKCPKCGNRMKNEGLELLWD